VGRAQYGIARSQAGRSERGKWLHDRQVRVAQGRKRPGKRGDRATVDGKAGAGEGCVPVTMRLPDARRVLCSQRFPAMSSSSAWVLLADEEFPRAYAWVAGSADTSMGPGAGGGVLSGSFRILRSAVR